MDVEKSMEFILDQQAKFSAGMEEMRQEMRQQMQETRQQMQEMRQQMQEMHQEMRQQAAAQGQINMALGKAMLGLTEHIDRLTAAQAVTDERLNALIGVVDGLIRRPPVK